jgi:hypothetical protein
MRGIEQVDPDCIRRQCGTVISIDDCHEWQGRMKNFEHDEGARAKQQDTAIPAAI